MLSSYRSGLGWSHEHETASEKEHGPHRATPPVTYQESFWIQMLSPGDDPGEGWCDEMSMASFRDPEHRRLTLESFRENAHPEIGDMDPGTRYRFIRRIITEEVIEDEK
jgi:hypothetical protein